MISTHRFTARIHRADTHRVELSCVHDTIRRLVVEVTPEMASYAERIAGGGELVEVEVAVESRWRARCLWMRAPGAHKLTGDTPCDTSPSSSP